VHMSFGARRAAGPLRVVSRVVGAACVDGRLMAPSVTAWAHTRFPELRADRPYHRPGDDSRPHPNRPFTKLRPNGPAGSRPWKNASYDVGDALSFLAVTVEAPGHRASAEPLAAQGDFAGLIEIGGRRIYLDCRGTGSPTVVLEAGYRSSARLWSEDLRQGEAPRTAVLAGVAGFTRVCAYDRPGTVAPLKDDVRPSRSDPVPQPRTAPDAVVDLHTLLRAAGVPGGPPTSSPATRWAVYHSLGGLFIRAALRQHVP
jgi:hypothetical protein